VVIAMGQGGGTFGLSDRLSLRVEDVGVVREAVEDGVGKRGVADDLMPVSGGELTGDQGRAPFVTVFDGFQEVPALGVVEFGESPVIEHQQVEAGRGAMARWRDTVSERAKSGGAGRRSAVSGALTGSVAARRGARKWGSRRAG
jgi:hypothetical protein